MNYYMDLRLLSDPEFVPGVLMNALAGKLHRALVLDKSLNIGISFPRKPSKGLGLGLVMRLHGSLDDLDRLHGTDWLRGMSDHVVVQAPSPVPTVHSFVQVRRQQAKSNGEAHRRRLVKRLAQREGVDVEAAEARVPHLADQRLDLPFLQLTSQSTGKSFRLFVEQEGVDTGFVVGEFSRYGFSQTATLPWF